MTKPTDLTLKEFDKWNAFLSVFRTLHPRIEAQMISVFLTIAMYEGKTQNQIAEMVGISQSSVSRNISALANFNGIALDLVSMRENPDDRRLKEVRLTAKGKMVLSQIRALM